MPPGMAENVYFAEYKIKLINQQLKERAPERILDFGCGPGRSIEFLASYFPRAEIWGFDVSEDSVKQARANNPNAKFVLDMDEIQNQEFDLIFAANVFHHIPKSEQSDALKACARVLKESGVMYIFEHNPYNPVTKRIFERCPFDVNAVMLPRSETVSIARGAGLELDKSGYTLFFPAQLSFLRFVEPWLSAIPMGAQYYVRLRRSR